MTESMVIEAGRFGIWDSVINGLTSSIVITFLLLLSAVLLALYIYNYFKSKRRTTISAVLPAVAISLFFHTFILWGTERTAESKMFNPLGGGFVLERWENEYVFPFLEQMEEKEIEVEAVKRIDVSKKTYYSKNQPEDLIPVSLIYRGNNDKGINWEGEALIYYDLKKEDTPYMKYKELKNDLGHGYEKGIINVELHLPKGYYFNQ
ncbi:hypothetical protein [Bacillus sp. EB01]|uniref:hypothetical protein n=1 Tax=Bacillus sp. EB01 TaxID=1347086 RepID=UPI0005C7093F|nr:hypothetical protein [Bacillus sp. EB01]